MKKISVILPVLNEAACISRRLRQLHAFRRQGHELIVADGGSSDDTVALAGPLADRVLTGARGRALQMNQAAAVAGGDILLFLHADTQLPEAAAALVEAALENAGWGWFDVRLDNPARHYRVIAWCMNRRARITRVCTGDQALFVKRELFVEIGCFPEIPLMEDVAISKRLRKRAASAVIDAVAVTSSRRWEQRGVSATVLLMWKLRLLYFSGVSPVRLVRFYYPDYPIHDPGIKKPAAAAVAVQAVTAASQDLPRKDYRYPTTRIVLFARAPVLGQVKTRLQPELGAEGSLALYKAMVRRMVTNVTDAKPAPLALWVSSNPSHEFFLSICNKESIHLQKGEDLGRRMSYSVTRTLASRSHDGEPVEKVVIIGSDCPVLDGDYLAAAIEALDAGNDVVIGPAEDGGYVLIGLKYHYSGLFEGIDWGTERVLRQTLAYLDRTAIRYTCLDTLWDVDRPRDLARLQTLVPTLTY